MAGSAGIANEGIALVGITVQAQSGGNTPVVNPPANSVLPAISGAAQVGSLLACSTGTWTNNPTTYTYQWFTQGVAITGATTSSYTVQLSDLGNQITCAVVATNTAGPSSAATSAPVGPVTEQVPANITAPSISGSLGVGSTLAASTGTWTNSPTSFSYQWKSNGTNVGSNSANYTLVLGDFGHTITVTVTASNVGGAGTPATSAGVGPVTQAVPVNTVAPVVSGTLLAGSVLSTTDGTWTNSPTSFSYQWKSNGVNVGTNANTYTLQISDVGKTVNCTVTASNVGGAGTGAVSNTVGPIAQSVPVNSVVPAITGTAKVGSTLTSSTGTWSNTPTSYAYQWKSNGTNVGTNQNTYVPVVGDFGHTITVTVTASNAGGAGSPATSGATSAVTQDAPTSVTAPTISGSAISGNVLTTTNGTWNNSPTGFTYQWKSNGSNVGTNANTYSTVSGDIGHTITCTVTASNAGGSGVPATSAAFGPITGAGTAPSPVQSKAANGTAASVPVTWTTTPTTGNLLVIVVNSDTTVATPSGWSVQSSVASMGCYLFYKKANGTNDSPTLTLTGSNQYALAQAEFNNISSATPFLVGNGTQSNVGTHDAFFASSMTAAAGPCLIVALIGSNTGSGAGNVLAAFPQNTFLPIAGGAATTGNRNGATIVWSTQTSNGTTPLLPAGAYGPGGPFFLTAQTSVVQVAFACAAVSAPMAWVAASTLDATNTGAVLGGTITTHSGDLSLTSGQTLTNTDVTGTLTISGTNVTVSNCKVGTAIVCDPVDVGGLIIRYTEVYGAVSGSAGITIDGANAGGAATPIVADHNNVHYSPPTGYMTDGVHFGTNYITWSNNWVHDMHDIEADPHYDCAQNGGGLVSLHIIGNHHYNNTQDTSSIFILQTLGGAFVDLVATGNYGGGSPQCIILSHQGGGVIDPAQVTFSGNGMYLNAVGASPGNAWIYFDSSVADGFEINQFQNMFFQTGYNGQP